MSRFDKETWRRLCGPYDPAHSYKARVDPKTAPDAKDCKHCGKRIAPIDSAWGQLWATAGGASDCEKSPDSFHQPG
ncbi:hypothetical protein ACFQ08_11880 [Streptosporangium algeriense]|uniref:Uncharacterized protein n=1 Tax=Streptosporangium algeriense TaxID=1682748 RepID=A0ABW3DN99_9ACTN